MIRCAARLAVAACAAAVLARLAVPRSGAAAVWMHARSKVGVATMTVAVARVKKPARLEEAGIAHNNITYIVTPVVIHGAVSNSGVASS